MSSPSGDLVGSEPSQYPGCMGQVAWDPKFRVLVEKVEFPLAFAQLSLGLMIMFVL